jgi:AraC family transcriptional regulator, ethanolamine operon transcriptional activator
MNLLHSLKHARAADEQAASLSRWDQRYEQISAGPFAGEVEELRLGPVQVFCEQANRTVMQLGRAEAGRETVALVCSAQTPGWYCGHALTESHFIRAPSGCEFELVAGAGSQILALSVDTQALQTLLTTLEGPDARLAPRFVSLQAHPDPSRAFARLSQAALAHAKPPSQTLARDASRRMLALALTEALLGCLRADAAAPSVLSSAAGNRRRIVAKARQYMQANAHEVITVPDLCQAIGTSRRALQYAFEDVLQVSPVTYLRTMRLNRVRQHIREQPERSVGDIAASWGFWHASRFATDYRALFAELPSATRAAAIRA